VARVWEWTLTLPAEGGRAAVRWGFTRAPGWVSVGPHAGLNLAEHVGDDPAAVRANRELLAADLGLAPERLVFMNQVHGARVATVCGPWGAGAAPDEADAMVTVEPGLALAVMVADCVPVLLADPAAGVVAVAHAGRPGMIAGVVPAVVAAMRAAGATDIVSAVGPSVCGRCYEVPDTMRAQGAAVAPVSATVSWTGTPALDVASGVVAQLREAGVASIAWVPGCTRESPHLYSYRRTPVTGRFAGVVVRSAG
jgi:YfiH family protein